MPIEAALIRSVSKSVFHFKLPAGDIAYRFFWSPKLIVLSGPVAGEETYELEEIPAFSLLIMALPGVSEKDGVAVMSAGKRLQMRLLLTGGTFNLKAMPLYVRKAWSLAKTRLARLGRRLVP